MRFLDPTSEPSLRVDRRHLDMGYRRIHRSKGPGPIRAERVEWLKWLAATFPSDALETCTPPVSLLEWCMMGRPQE